MRLLISTQRTPQNSRAACAATSDDCAPPFDAGKPACRLARRDALQRMADDAQVEQVLARAQQRRRQRHELRPRAVARHRLDHSAAAEDQGAVEVDLHVAARALDVEREQLVGSRRAVEAKAGAVPDRSGVSRVRDRPSRRAA